MSNVTVNRGSTDTNKKDSQGYRRIGQSERIVSMIAGTTLASSAMRSRSLLSATLLLGVSAGLLHRGATGKCGFGKAMDKVNSMVNNLSGEIADRTGNSNSNSGSANGGNNNKNNNSGNSGRSASRKANDEVSQASKDSFPASDPPSFTPVTGEAGRTHMNK